MRLADAVAFVRARGTPAEQARLDNLLGAPPAPDLLAGAFAGQRPDGGWAPFWAPGYSSLDATCYRLAQAEPLGLVHASAPGRRALDFLARRQRADGRWQEAPPIGADLPPWLAPADPASVSYLTANCGLWLTLRPRDAPHAQRAAAYLERCAPAAQPIALPPGAWLTAALWYACDRRPAAELLLSELARQHPQLPAGALAWALTSLGIAGLPRGHWFIAGGAGQLAALQRADGGWGSDDGAERDVHVTLEAIRALRAPAP